MGAIEKRSKLEIRVDHMKRLFMWHFLSKKLDLVLVSEFPKSGGSWVAQMLADYLEKPFPRNIGAKFESSIMHGHELHSDKFEKPFCVLRDGRDVIISFYHHMMIGNKRMAAHARDTYRAMCPFDDYDDVKGNLPKYIDFIFTEYRKKPGKFSWKDHVNSYWGKEGVVFIRYEDLLEDTAGTMFNALYKKLGEEPNLDRLRGIEEKYSFKNQSKREKGTEKKDHFLRKGIAGDWKNYFGDEAAAMFDKHAGKELVRFGYEKDRNWF